MKTRILKFSLALAVAIAAGYITYSSQTETQQLSGVTLVNVKALADGESENYHCDAPYTLTCSYEGSHKIPGVKR